MNIESKLKSHINTVHGRDYRKLRSNPSFFLKKLACIKWEALKDTEDIDHMEKFWSEQINKYLDFVAPWKSKKFKQKNHCLPKHVQEAIQVSNELIKRHEIKSQKGEKDFELMKKFKKHRNYCNKLIKEAFKEKSGENIASDSSVKDI